jgi:phosphoglycolate phosphatase
MLIQSVIFDLDGTLLDTLEDLAAAANLALDAHGFPTRPVSDYRLLVGAGARNLMTRAAVTASEEQVSSLLKTFNQAYDRNWADRTCSYDGIHELLTRLRSAGCQLAVVSNKPDVFTRQVISHYFADDLFDAVAGKLDGWPLKPDPALTLEICRQIGAEPASTALVGDSGSDMKTAVNAGLLPVGVLWGFRDRAELLAGGARHLASDPSDLYNILTGGDSK